jgi:hypothetical protein
MIDMPYIVNVDWDDEAKVYVATSEDVPGLVAEAPTLDGIREKVMALIPELLEDNAHLLAEPPVRGDLVRLCVESSFSLEPARAH